MGARGICAVYGFISDFRMNNQKGINTDNAVSWASYTSKWLVLLERKLPRELLGRSLCPSTKPFCCLDSVRNQTSHVAWAAVDKKHIHINLRFWPDAHCALSTVFTNRATSRLSIIARPDVRGLSQGLASLNRKPCYYRRLSMDQWAQGGGTARSGQVLVWSWRGRWQT